MGEARKLCAQLVEVQQLVAAFGRRRHAKGCAALVGGCEGTSLRSPRPRGGVPTDRAVARRPAQASCSAASTRPGRSSPRSSTTSATSSASTARRPSSSQPRRRRRAPSFPREATAWRVGVPCRALSVDVGGSSVSVVGIGKPTLSKPNPSKMPSVTEVASASSVGGLGALAVPDAISERTEQPGSLPRRDARRRRAAAAHTHSACTSRCSSRLLISDVENPSGALPPLGATIHRASGEASVSGERLRPRRRDVEGGARRDAGAERRGVGRGAA